MLKVCKSRCGHEEKLDFPYFHLNIPIFLGNKYYPPISIGPRMSGLLSFQVVFTAYQMQNMARK